jgi:heptaprenyl diphosphate synthase
MDMKIRKMIFLGIMISISIVVSIVEAQISTVLFIIPGVKLGLANIVTLIILYIYGKKDAFLVLILRILIVALIYSAMPAPLLSLAGGLCAFGAMILFQRFKSLSIISVSVAGALMHMVGQILMAILILKTELLILYLPYMLILSVPTGIFTGIVAKKLTQVFEKTLRTNEN